jgi:N-acetylneuraminate synthase/sialic acid synthase
MLTIGDRPIGDETDAWVIAELAQNHGGSLDTAIQMVRAAAEAGCNAVKLQKRDNRRLYTRALYDSPYHSEHAFGPTYGSHREALEFGRNEWVEIIRFAADLGLVCFGTAFDVASADFLADLEVPAYKIASGDLTNTPLLRHVARFGKPMILSTGGGTLADVRLAVETILPLNDQLCLLQCTAVYPCAAEQMHLRVIDLYRQEFPGLVVGLSDHQSGIAMALVAYALGARVFEKHFTLNRASKGSDHAFSLEPNGLRRLVRDLRRARLAMGDGAKRALPEEMPALRKMGKSLVAARDLPAGTLLTAEHLAIKSPGGGMPPYRLESLIGQMTDRALEEDEGFADAIASRPYELARSS